MTLGSDVVVGRDWFGIRSVSFCITGGRSLRKQLNTACQFYLYLHSSFDAGISIPVSARGRSQEDTTRVARVILPFSR